VNTKLVQEYRYGNIYEMVKIIYAPSNSRFVQHLKCSVSVEYMDPKHVQTHKQKARSNRTRLFKRQTKCFVSHTKDW